MEENPRRCLATKDFFMAQEMRKPPRMALAYKKMTAFPFSYTLLIVRDCLKWNMGQEEYCCVLLLGFVLICPMG